MPVYITYICMCDVTNIVERTTSAAIAAVLLLAAQSALGDKHWIALSAGKQSPIVSSSQPPVALAFSASTQHCAN